MPENNIEDGLVILEKAQESGLEGMSAEKKNEIVTRALESIDGSLNKKRLNQNELQRLQNFLARLQNFEQFSNGVIWNRQLMFPILEKTRRLLTDFVDYAGHEDIKTLSDDALDKEYLELSRRKSDGNDWDPKTDHQRLLVLEAERKKRLRYRVYAGNQGVRDLPDDELQREYMKLSMRNANTTDWDQETEGQRLLALQAEMDRRKLGA